MNKNIHILIAVFLILFSVRTYAASSSEDPFYIFCSENANPEYKKFVRAPNSSDGKWRKKLTEFAEKGEASAIKTIVLNSKTSEITEIFLRKLANNKNRAAYPFLAGHLDNIGNPECLIWYEKCEDNFVDDPDSVINYSLAISRFVEPSTANIDKALALVQRWERELMTTSDEDSLFCAAAYELIFKNAKKLNYSHMILKYLDWPHRFPATELAVRGVFVREFEETPYIDLIIKEKGVVPIMIKPEDLFRPDNIIKIAAKIVKKHQEYDKDIVSHIVGKLSYILQDKDVREVPNCKYKDFNPNQATKEQITFWARDIITRRSQLVDYAGENVMFQTLFKEIGNVTLEKYIVVAFKEMFDLDF